MVQMQEILRCCCIPAIISISSQVATEINVTTNRHNYTCTHLQLSLVSKLSHSWHTILHRYSSPNSYMKLYPPFHLIESQMERTSNTFCIWWSQLGCVNHKQLRCTYVFVVTSLMWQIIIVFFVYFIKYYDLVHAMIAMALFAIISLSYMTTFSLSVIFFFVLADDNKKNQKDIRTKMFRDECYNVFMKRGEERIGEQGCFMPYKGVGNRANGITVI